MLLSPNTGSQRNEGTTFTSFTNTTTEEQLIKLSFWNIVERMSTQPGEDYVVTFSAYARLGTVEATDVAPLLRVRVIDPSELTVIVGAEGNGGDHHAHCFLCRLAARMGGIQYR